MCLAVPGKIVRIHDDRGVRMAMVDFDGIRKEICLVYVPDVDVGEYVIVHAGFAISHLDDASAQETLAMLREVGAQESGVDETLDHGDAVDMVDATEREL